MPYLVAYHRGQLIHIVHGLYEAGKKKYVPARPRKGIQIVLFDDVKTIGEMFYFKGTDEVMTQRIDIVVGKIIIHEFKGSTYLHQESLAKYGLILEG
jgi:hypothetical protein